MIDVNYGNKTVETATTIDLNQLARKQIVQTKRNENQDETQTRSLEHVMLQRSLESMV